MSAGTLQKGPRAVSPLAALGILAAAALACLAPFLNKAVCLDDPLFLWAADQIRAHPFDFYGCDVNWYSDWQPLYDVMKNPPLASYYLAAVSVLFGQNERVLHAACLLPAVGALWGAWFLARSLCSQPVWAVVAALATPAFLVSSTNLMSDTPMLCMWTWAIALWVNGLKAGKNGRLLTSAFLIGAAGLTKYFAISLIPLLALYTIQHERKPTARLAWLLVPAALLGGYQWWTWRQYGRGLLSDAAAFAWHIAEIAGPDAPFSEENAGSKTLVGLSFLGGSFAAILFVAPWLWRARNLIWPAAGALAIAAWARWIATPGQRTAIHMNVPFTALSAGQFAVFTICGILVLWLATSDLARRRTADACLLAAWVWGTFMFAAFVNWTCNVRSMLPIAPALGILLLRRLEQDVSVDRPLRWPVNWRWALLPSAALALFVTWADFCLANSARDAAAELGRELNPARATVWFGGHWGFQYYMRAQGASPIDLSRPQCEPGDLLINPLNNTDVYFFGAEYAEPIDDVEVPACRWLATVQTQVGAGFYSGIWGPMPFVFGPVPPERYQIYEFKRTLE